MAFNQEDYNRKVMEAMNNKPWDRKMDFITWLNINDLLPPLDWEVYPKC